MGIAFTAEKSLRRECTRAPVKRGATFFRRYLSALGQCILAFGPGVFFRKYRNLIHQIATNSGPFSISGTKVSELIPEISWSRLLETPPPVLVLEPDAANGNVSALELLCINQWICHTKAKTIFEIGTFDGRTTLNMAVNIGSEGRIYTLDLPAKEVDQTALPLCPGDRLHIQKPASGNRFLYRKERTKIEQFFGDSGSFDFRPYFGKFDLVFVDGSHSYSYVKNDSEIALRLLKTGKGCILWHDYGVFEGVTRGLNDLFVSHPELRRMQRIAGTSLVICTAGDGAR